MLFLKILLYEMRQAFILIHCVVVTRRPLSVLVILRKAFACTPPCIATHTLGNILTEAE